MLIRHIYFKQNHTEEQTCGISLQANYQQGSVECIDPSLTIMIQVDNNSNVLKCSKEMSLLPNNPNTALLSNKIDNKEDHHSSDVYLNSTNTDGSKVALRQSYRLPSPYCTSSPSDRMISHSPNKKGISSSIDKKPLNCLHCKQKFFRPGDLKYALFNPLSVPMLLFC
jgi:hypothetical protein